MSASLIAAAVLATPRLANIVGTTIRSTADRVFVGTTDGKVYGFERNGGYRYLLTGGTGPVTDIVSVDGNVMWSCKDSPMLFAVGPGLTPQTIDLPSSGFRGPIRRLMVWKNHIVAQSDTDIRFIHSRERKIKTLAAFMPREQAAVAMQGPILAHWQGSRGMIFSVRRIGQYTTAREPGGYQDIAKISAWSLNGSRSRFLGAYTCAAAQFRDAEGPEVVDFNEGKEVRLPFGAADIGNFRIGPEGVAILERDRIRLVPFAKQNWEPLELDLPISPRYAQKFAVSGNQAWWIDGRRVLQANLEDGSVEVFSMLDPKLEVRDLASDDSGCYLATNQGIRRLDSDAAPRGWVHYSRGYGDGPETYEQKQLAKLVAEPDRFFSLTGSAKNPTDALVKLLNTARVSLRPVGANRTKNPKVTRDLEYGDVIVQGNESRLYVGDGRTIALVGDNQLEMDLDLSRMSHAYRVLEPDPFQVAMPAGGVGTINVTPIGLLSPSSRQGQRGYLRWKPGSRYDRPYLPVHERMRDEIATWIGTPYVWAGQSKNGTDCSGFVMMVFRSLGVRLPRHSQDMGRVGFGRVVTDELRYGDVMVFPRPKHVAIYVGNGRTAEAISMGVTYSYVSRHPVAVVRRFF